MNPSIDEDTPNLDVLTLASPADLLNAVPFLLGFHPARSLVALSLHGERNRVGLTMRMDYPGEAVVTTVGRLVEHLSGDAADAALLVAYVESSDIDERIEIAQVRQIASDLIIAGLEIRDALVVSGQKWWSALCDQSCCPVEGNTLPDFATSSVAAHHVFHGALLPLANEDALVESLSTQPSSRVDQLAASCAKRREAAMRELIDENEGPRQRSVRQRHLQEGAAAIDALFAHWLSARELDSLDVETLSAAFYGMLEVHVRDYAMGMHNDDEVAAAADLWRAMVVIAPRGFIAPVATVLAAVCFEMGEGVIAQRALDRAFDDRMGYPMASLLRQALEAGWTPSAMTAMRHELRAAVIAAVKAA
jgi:hypothetical protein